MKSKFKKLMAAALVLCLMLALLPVSALADDTYTVTFYKADGTTATNPNGTYALGTISVTDEDGNTGPFAAGTTVTLTAKPNANEHSGLSYLKIGDDKIELPLKEGQFTKNFEINNNVSVVAEFSRLFSITTDSTVEGVASYGIVDGFYMRSKTITFTPEAQDGYKITGMSITSYTQPSEDGTPVVYTETNGTYSFTIPAGNVEIVASAERVEPPVVQTPHNIKLTVLGEGYLGTDKTDQTANYGDTVMVYAYPKNSNYELVSLVYVTLPYTGTSPEVIKNSKFIMPDSDVEIIATFKRVEPVPEEYSIEVTTNGNCTFEYESSAKPGDVVDVCIYPDTGYHLYSVTFNGDLVTDDVYWYNGHWHYSFYMPWHDVDIYVATTDKLFVNTVYDINGGAVELLVKDAVSGDWDSTIYADAGEWVCVKATPKSGYELGDISVTGRWSGKTYDIGYYWYDGCYYFKMPYESVNLSVSFIDNSHKVTVKDVTNGSLTVNTKWAVEDERVYITAVPDKGYELTWLYVKAADGSSVKVYEAIKEDTYYFFMPDQEVTVSAIFAYDYPDMPFIDVNPNSWYYSAIEFVYNKGIMNGVTASSFNPDGTITRGMIVTMLWRMAGEPSAVSAGFADVAADSYYAKAIAWAANNGIIEGYSASSFGPNDAITREQLATVLYRYAKYLGYTTTGSSLSGYYDASRVSSWAKDAMGWAVKNGVVTGLSSTWLNPNGTASRAEAAQMFMNFYEFLG